MSPARPVAQLAGVRKRLGGTDALDGLDLDVEEGSVTALLGPNGAGKTTAVHILLGQRRPDAGTVSVLGRSPLDRSVRRQIGVTPQSMGFPPTLRVGEVVDLVRAHHRDPLPATAVLDAVGLAGLARRQTGGMSGGQYRRLALALALVGRPRMLVLDEPTTGLDVDARQAVWEQVRQFRARGGTTLIATHDLEEADALATRVALIARGKLVAAASPAEVKRAVGYGRVVFRAPPGAAFDGLPGVSAMTRDDDLVTVVTADTDAVVRALVRFDVPFAELQVQPVTLEEAVSVALRGIDAG